jgi:hypothetical protein
MLNHAFTAHCFFYDQAIKHFAIIARLARLAAHRTLPSDGSDERGYAASGSRHREAGELEYL